MDIQWIYANNSRAFHVLPNAFHVFSNTFHVLLYAFIYYYIIYLLFCLFLTLIKRQHFKSTLIQLYLEFIQSNSFYKIKNPNPIHGYPWIRGSLGAKRPSTEILRRSVDMQVTAFSATSREVNVSLGT